MSKPDTLRRRVVDALRSSRRARAAGRTMEIRGPAIRGDDGVLRQFKIILGQPQENKGEETLAGEISGEKLGSKSPD